MNTTLSNRLEIWLKFASSLLAIAAFFWGIYTYSDAARQQAETRRIEAARPFLDKQLSLYTEVTQVTAVIATSTVITDVTTAKQRFYELYWGELALVERGKVVQAMIKFREALDNNHTKDLARLSLDLAHACREELATSWGVDNWKRVQPTPTPTP